MIDNFHCKFPMISIFSFLMNYPLKNTHTHTQSGGQTFSTSYSEQKGIFRLSFVHHSISIALQREPTRRRASPEI